ncbi:uncharacterized protein LOC126579078 [Anopheles aquasalis]|uniref:uncharacterized protein LOC126579078 n=1 Tax=Anopheles aquasalis TaxID=42839 RepID=UPI00215A5554|nr:uncharacterized protein LOC126579078 [Anopheles aquasalis]
MSTSVSSPATGGGAGGEVATAGGGVKSSYRLSLKRQSPSYDGTDLGTGSREPWISTNKILNSSYCGRRTNSRNPNFDYDESKLLISLWGDPHVQKALITTHKKHPVIAELARKMREHGYNRSTEEINTRIKNLKCFYNRIKKDMAAGLINQTTWRHYADMDEIISRPVFGNRKKSDHDSLDEDGRSTQSLELEPPPLPSDEPLPVKLELMSDDDDDGGGNRDDDEPSEIRAEDLLTIDASFPEETSAAASSSSSSSGAGGGSGIAKKSYPSAASRSNGRTTHAGEAAGAGRSSESTAAVSVRKGRAGGNADCRQDDEDDDDDDDDEDDDEEDDEDDDDDGSDFDVENEFNDGLDEILLKAQSKGNSSATGSKTIAGNGSNCGSSTSDSIVTSKGSGTSGLVIENVTSGSGAKPSTSMAAAPPPQQQQQQQGKISVVPTNLLLKSPSSLPSSSLSTPIQIFTKPTVSLATAVGGSTVKPTTMGIGTGAPTPGAPMKLLLVNTVGKDGTTKQILTPAGDMTTLPKLMPTATLKQGTTTVPLSLASTSGASQQIISIPANVAPNKVPTIAGVHSLPKHMPIGRPPGLPGTERESATPFKALLTQLVTIQRENLALNQERLALEKERLEFETKFGGSFVSMIQNMSTFFSNMLKHQRQDLQQSRQTVATKEGEPVQPKETKSVESKKPESSASASAATSEPRTPEVSTLDPKQPTAAPAATTPTITSTSVAIESPTPATAPIGKHPLPAPPALTPLVVTASKPNNADETVGTPLPKKRRMMTRNATQPATSTTEDPLKTEVISDNDDHPPPRGTGLRLNLGSNFLTQRKIQARQRLRLARHQHQQQQQQQGASGSGTGTSPASGNRRPKYNMWVSTNKVLIGSVGGLKKTHCRNPNFDSEETKLLISLWGDPQVQRTLITTHKKHPVIAKLAEKMREYGYNRSTEEINTRIKNLKCFYNRIKKDLETGVASETSWKHYQAMDDILTRPVFGNNRRILAAREDTRGSRSRGHGDTGDSGPGYSADGGSGSDVPSGEPAGGHLDSIGVKLELASDEEKELRAVEMLMRNAEQVELREPNLLIPKDEPMEMEEEDDPNDPDFEHDGGSETDDESSGMDEADKSERSTRFRRRTKRVHKPSSKAAAAANAAAGGGGSGEGQSSAANTMGRSSSVTFAASAASTSSSQAVPVPGTIKIINYSGGGKVSISTSTVNASTGATVVTATAAPTLGGITTQAGRSGAAATTTTQSKISLVPTNFLLKPQASGMGFKQPIQLYTKPTVTIQGGKAAAPGSNPGSIQPIVSIGSGTTPGSVAGQPMKLYLVNTMPKDGSAPKQQLIAPGGTSQLYGGTSAASIPGMPIQPKPTIMTTASGATRILQAKTAPVTGGTGGGGGGAALRAPLGFPPKMGGFKTLLNQLVGLQRDNLAITRTRLSAEKERFKNEKSVANSVLRALGDLNELLVGMNAELEAVGAVEEKPVDAGKCSQIQITDVRHDPHRRPSVNQEDRQGTHSAAPGSEDEENMKTEIISDSEEG